MSTVTNAVWEMSEGDRRRAFAQRAAKAARRALHTRDFIQVSSSAPVVAEPVPAASDAPAKPTTWRHDLYEVANKHGINPLDIVGVFRDRPLVAARYELFWRLRTERKFSFGRIGLLLNRDHATVKYGVAKHAAKLEESNAPVS